MRPGASLDDAVCRIETSAQHKNSVISVIRLIEVFLLNPTTKSQTLFGRCTFFYRLFIALTFYSCTDVSDSNPLVNELIKAVAANTQRSFVTWFMTSFHLAAHLLFSH